MVIIGFDPGLSHTGYAVLNKEGNNINLVQCGLISPKRNKSLSERLFAIFSETNKLIEAVSYTHLTLPTNREV